MNRLAQRRIAAIKAAANLGLLNKEAAEIAVEAYKDQNDGPETEEDGIEYDLLTKLAEHGIPLDLQEGIIKLAADSAYTEHLQAHNQISSLRVLKAFYRKLYSSVGIEISEELLDKKIPSDIRNKLNAMDEAFNKIRGLFEEDE